MSYRPARVGFLVRPGVIDDVVAAARLNTLLWGGLWNPIVAVGDAAAAARWLARFRVDLVYPVAGTDEIRAVAEAHPHLGWPMGDDELMRVRYGEEAAEPTLLDVAPAMEDFHAARGWAVERSQYRLFEWDADDDLAPLFVVRFGELHGDTGARYCGMFESQLRGATVRPDEVDFGEKHVPSPIDVTTFSLRHDFIGRARQGIAVGDPRSADDLRDYWNLRAGGYEVDFFVSEAPLGRALERRLALHRHRLAELREWQRHVHVFRLGGAAVPERLQQLLDGLETVEHDGIEAAWSAGSPPTMAVTESHDVLAGTDSLGQGRAVLPTSARWETLPRRG